MESQVQKNWKIGKLENWKNGKLGPEKLENWKNGKSGPEKLENWEIGKMEVRPRKIGKLEKWKVGKVASCPRKCVFCRYLPVKIGKCRRMGGGLAYICAYIYTYRYIGIVKDNFLRCLQDHSESLSSRVCRVLVTNLLNTEEPGGKDPLLS